MHFTPRTRCALRLMALMLAGGLMAPCVAWAQDELAAGDAANQQMMAIEVAEAGAPGLEAVAEEAPVAAKEAAPEADVRDDPAAEAPEQPEATLDERDAPVDAPTSDEQVPAEQDVASENADDATVTVANDELAPQTDATPVVDEGPALPEGAATVREGVYYLEAGVKDDKVLGVADETPKGHSAVRSYTYDGSANQRWSVVRDELSGWYQILLVGADGAVATEGTHQLALGKARDSKALELLYPDMVGDRALWAFMPNGSWFNLINRALPDHLLDIAKASTANGAQAKLYKTSESAKNRRFYLVDAKPQVEAGVQRDATVAYRVSPYVNQKLAAEVRGGKAAAGTNVWLYANKGGQHQKVFLESAGNGYYKIWMVGTGKVLAQASSAVIPGTNVVQRVSTGADTQLWALQARVRDGKTYYALVNKATGLALGAAGSSSGSNLVGTRNDGYKTTLFALTHVPILPAGIVEIHPQADQSLSLDVQKAASSGSANLLLWTDNDALNQRFELVDAGATDRFRIRTASSGGWVTAGEGTTVQQQGKGADAATDANTWVVGYRDGGYTLQNLATGAVLDFAGGKASKGARLLAQEASGTASQLLSIKVTTLIAPGYYFLKNAGGTYLEVKGSSQKDGADVQVYKATKGMNQLFQLEQSGTSWRIQNAFSELYVTASTTKNGTNVVQKKLSSSSKNQLWKMVITDGGGVSFVSVANPQLALNGTGYGKTPGKMANAYTNKAMSGQRWTATALGDGKLTKKQQQVVTAAMTTPSAGPGYCAAWITNVFSRAKIGYWGGDACDQYRWFCNTADVSKLKTGMIVAVSTHGHTWAGGIWGHVAVYIGGGKIMDNVGSIRTMSFYDWVSYYGDRVTPKWGWFGKQDLTK